MALKLGAYTACLHDRPLAEALQEDAAYSQLDGLALAAENHRAAAAKM